MHGYVTTKISVMYGSEGVKVDIVTSPLDKISLRVAKITFVVAQITFNVALMTSAVQITKILLNCGFSTIIFLIPDCKL